MEAEVVIMAFVVGFAKLITDTAGRQSVRIDILSVVSSALGLVFVVFGMLQSKTWGWIVPLHSPVVGGVEVAPFGISLSAWFMLVGGVLIWYFVHRQVRLVAAGRPPLVHVS
ncbi:hypothetical protein ACC691_36950, partial [Rhizobium johnstonii]|uniref:hypothetical protein n=1 Tax=Rhizobium johnstonii TaxID=3019933 RepID=UPI003F94F7AF